MYPNTNGATTQFQKFQTLTSQYSRLQELNNDDLDQKITFAQHSINFIGYSWGWILFWTFFGGILFGFTISLVIALSNHSKRQMYFQMEINRLNNIKYQRQNLNNYNAKQEDEMKTSKFSEEKINEVLNEVDVNDL